MEPQEERRQGVRGTKSMQVIEKECEISCLHTDFITHSYALQKILQSSDEACMKAIEQKAIVYHY